jgi:hypothetical protein
MDPFGRPFYSHMAPPIDPRMHQIERAFPTTCAADVLEVCLFILTCSLIDISSAVAICLRLLLFSSQRFPCPHLPPHRLSPEWFSVGRTCLKAQPVS